MTMFALRSLACVVGLAALAGCTPMRWEQPGIGPEATQMALAECSEAAYREARDEEWRYRFLGSPYPFRDRFGRVYWWRRDPFHDPFYDDSFFREQDLRSFCMRSKGFRLVPQEEVG